MTTDVHAAVSLESGDRLTREEFHRRYSLRPDIKKAELIRGVVYVASPVRDIHGKCQTDMALWSGNYALGHPGVEMRTETSVFLGDGDEFRPDVLLYRVPPPLGGARVREDGYLEGPPQLVIEIAISSVSNDLHDKLRSYEEAGVPEYLVWRYGDTAFDWLRLVNGRYVRVEPDTDGVIESSAFPGLRLAITALLAGDYATVMQVAQHS